MGFPILFYLKTIQTIFKRWEYICCLGYKNLELKTKIITSLSDNGSLAEPIISSSAFVSESADIFNGAVIYPGGKY